MTDPIRVCSRCKTPKPETRANFAYRIAARKIFRSICRACIKDYDRARPPRNYSSRGKPLRVVGPRICSQCHNMSWCRPVDERCKCGGLHAPEPKPDLMLRRHYEAAV